ncbi:MAG: hypothetical protein R6X23_12320 [Acidimicrobiia bacterium]
METLVEGRAFLEGPRWHDGALFDLDIACALGFSARSLLPCNIHRAENAGRRCRTDWISRARVAVPAARLA